MKQLHFAVTRKFALKITQRLQVFNRLVGKGLSLGEQILDRIPYIREQFERNTESSEMTALMEHLINRKAANQRILFGKPKTTELLLPEKPSITEMLADFAQAAQAVWDTQQEKSAEHARIASERIFAEDRKACLDEVANAMRASALKNISDEISAEQAEMAALKEKYARSQLEDNRKVQGEIKAILDKEAMLQSAESAVPVVTVDMSPLASGGLPIVTEDGRPVSVNWSEDIRKGSAESLPKVKGVGGKRKPNLAKKSDSKKD